MHSEGKLEGKLTYLFTQNKKYKKLVAQYKRLLKETNNAAPKTQVAAIEQQIHAMIIAVHTEAKDLALPFVKREHPEIDIKYKNWKNLQIRR